nr:MAG TPA: hypothetical protein [Caudoviricetes sp.]
MVDYNNKEVILRKGVADLAAPSSFFLRCPF